METLALNYPLDQMDLTDVYRTPTPGSTFLTAHGAFSKIDHMLTNKINLRKFTKIEITLSIF